MICTLRSGILPGDLVALLLGDLLGHLVALLVGDLVALFPGDLLGDLQGSTWSQILNGKKPDAPKSQA